MLYLFFRNGHIVITSYSIHYTKLYDEFYNNRFVVVARKVRDGEDDTVNTEAISENPEKYMPLAWYEVTGQKSPR